MQNSSPAAATADEVCVVDNVAHTYQTGAGAVEVLKGFTVQLRAGEVAAIVGPSGSGKSTLLSIMGLLLKPTSGRIRIDGTEVGRMSAEERARFRADHISFIFQAFHLVDHLTVRENIRLARTYSNKSAAAITSAESTSGIAHSQRNTRSQRNAHRQAAQTADVDELIEMVGLMHRRDAYPAQLSGGEKQRCAIARALNSDARLLLCDEPTGNLDERNSARVIEIISQVAHTPGRAVGLITHDLNIAAQADAVYAINHGSLEVERAP